MRPPRLLDALIAFSFLLAVNVGLTAHRWLPDQDISLAAEPAIETVVIGLAVLGLILTARRVRRYLTAAMVLVLAALLLFALGETLMRLIYQRSFNPWIDIGFISVGLELLAGDLGGRAETYEALAIAGFVLSALAVSSGLLGGTVLVFQRRASHPLAILAGIAPAVIGIIFLRLPDPLSASILDNLRRPRAVPIAALEPPGQSESAAEEQPEAPTSGAKADPLPGLAGRDVYLIFVESYGQAAFSRPVLRQGLESSVTEAEGRLERAGFLTVSTFLESPVSGGWSWLAEATLLTGVRIDTQVDYDALLASDRGSIPRTLQEMGYYTLVSMPGAVHGEWPEGIGFYHFDDRIFGPQFDYIGPGFSFVAVPDQYAVWKTENYLEDRREKADSDGEPRTPSYIQMVLVSSHAPFNLIPTFVEDWQKLGDGSVYEDLPVLEFDNDWLSGREYDQGYTSAVSYVLRVISEFAARFVDGEALIIVLGDHQPKRPIREKDAGRSVPIHLISRDSELLARFTPSGFTRGFVPNQPPPHPGMETFYELFLDVLRR